MLVKLNPSKDAIYELFSKAAGNLVRGTELLSDLISLGADVQSISGRLAEVEHQNDGITHELYQKINANSSPRSTGRTSTALDPSSTMSWTTLRPSEACSTSTGSQRCQPCPREMRDMVEVLAAQARVTAEAMPKLKTLKNLEDYWVECNRLENEGDTTYRMLLVRLFSGEYDALTIMKMKEVVDEMEAACDAFEHVANTVETIVVKET